MKVRALRILAAIAATLAVSAGIVAPPASAATGRQETFDYAPGLQLDAFWNEGATDAPWVLLIHGGYWSGGSRSAMDATAAKFRSAGFAAFSLDYRLTEDAVWPAQRDDAITALDWIEDNAAQFGVDPDRVVVIGESAGAHIALALATKGAGADRIRGAVALSAPANPHAAWKAAHIKHPTARQVRLADSALLLHRCTPWDPASDCYARWTKAFVAGAAGKTDAPALLVHAKSDAVVPVSQSIAFDTRASAHGISVTLMTPSGSTHGVRLLASAPVWKTVLAWAVKRTR